MRYLVWIFRTALFLLALGFAIKNDQPVVLNYFFGYTWKASLVVVLLSFFSAGVLIGVLSMFASLFSQRRELARLKREIQLNQKRSKIDVSQPNTNLTL